MENNEENKAKFFAKYLKSELIVEDEPKEHYYPFSKNEGALRLHGILGKRIIVFRIAEEVDDRFHQTKLLLKPLSSITDEDAVEVWDLLHPNGGNKKDLTNDEIIKQGKNIASSLNYVNGGWMVGLLAVVNCYQYLQSKGYALPYMGLSVEKLIEYGWVKLNV